MIMMGIATTVRTFDPEFVHIWVRGPDRLVPSRPLLHRQEPQIL